MLKASFSLLMALALCLGPTSGFAAIPDDGLGSGDVFDLVTSVAKRPQTQAEVPGLVTTITAQEMEELGITTIEEALKLVPGFEVAFQPRRSTVYTRGVVESALVLIDGVSIVSPLDNEVFLDEAIDIAIVDRIEVIRGPGGVLWGPTAFVGVVNIVTKSPSNEEGTMKTTYEYGSYNRRKLGLFYDKKGEDFSIVTNVSELRTDDYKLKSDNITSPYTGYWADGYENTSRKEDFFRELFLKATYKDLTLTTRFADEEDWYQIDNRGRSTGPTLDLVEKDPIKQYISLEYDKDFSLLGVRAKAYTMNRESYLEGLYNPNLSRSGVIHWVFEPWMSRNRGTELELTTDKLIPTNNLLVGAAYMERDATDINTFDKVVDYTGGPAGEVVDLNDFFLSGGWFVTPELQVEAGNREAIGSFYLNDTWNIVRSLAVSGGYRYDKYSGTDKSIQNYSGNMVYQFLPGHYLKYIYAEGFRLPDLEQRFSSTWGGDLSPERSASNDVQYNAEIGGRLSYFVNYARTVVDNLVILRDTGLTPPFDSRYTNGGKRVMHSQEAGFKINTNGRRGYIFANYNHTTAQDVDSGDVKEIANHVANLGIHQPLTKRLSASLIGHYEGEKESYMLIDGERITGNPRTQPKPLQRVRPYTVMNAGLLYRWDRIQASVFVYNVLNTHYESVAFPGQGLVPLPNPERYAIAKVSYAF